jgi:hypothetical protein
MFARRCCEQGPSMAVIPLDNRPAPATKGGATVFRRCRDVAVWILAGSAFALIPKCPACLAAWIAIATGFGVSFATASALQTALYAISIVSLACLVIHFLWARMRRSDAEKNAVPTP